MRYFGLLRMDIVLETNFFTKKTFLREFLFLEEYFNGIYANAFDYEKRKKLNSINDIDLSLNITYIIEYHIDGVNFFIELYKDYFQISISKYSDTSLNKSLIPILQKYALISNFILLGFETTLFINEYPNCVDSILIDESLYPLYVNQSRGNLSFICYSGYKPMEEIMEKFLVDIFGSKIDIIYNKI